MRTLAILVVAVVALMGAASAWEDGFVLQYSLKRTIAEQDDFTNMGGAASGTWFADSDGYGPGSIASNPHGDLTAGVTNTLVSVTPTFFKDYYGNDITGNTHQSLTQGAKITVALEAEDSEDDNPELTVDIAKHQEYAFSGQFDSMSATFKDIAAAGGNYLPALSDITDGQTVDCGNVHAWEESTVTGSILTDDVKDSKGKVINANDAKISEGAIGMDSWTSLKADGWLEIATMDGGIAPYAQFFGDSLVPLGDTITTTVSGSATHTWNNGAGW